jgi:hypothetical protein
MDLFDFTGQQGLEESAALQVEFAIADYFDIETFPPLPDLQAATDNEDYVDLGDATIGFKAGKHFHRFEASLEYSSYSSQLVGPRGAKSFENMLTIGRTSTGANMMGFLRANRNRKLIVAFKELGDTQYRIIGWLNLAAEVDEGGSEVAAEVSGEKLTTMVIRSIYHPTLFIDSVPFTAPE